MYRLVIAEKPSVAQSIAKAIGATSKKSGYWEGNGYLVSWCVGHLIQLSNPESYHEKYKKWRYEDLPILPDAWKYQVSQSTKKQYQILKELMERDDVESLVEATDAGREGELIFRLVYHQAKCRKPFERLWISSLENKAIVDGFTNLKSGKEYTALYEAALSRERADWIVGMNATRLFSTLYGQTLNVGRVLSPTLAMIVARETEITKFKVEPFYSVAISIGGVIASSERVQNKDDAENLLQIVKTDGRVMVTNNTTTTKKEKAPMLYDLTNLQRDANRIMGFTAQQTLDYTQSLYEKKLVTYPRTDSRFLTEDMEYGLPVLVKKMASKFGYTKTLSVNTKQVINNKKVGDHHAIIPTQNVSEVNYGELPIGEQRILSLILARMLASIGNPCIWQETELEFTCASHSFKTKVKAITDYGWKDVEYWILGKKVRENLEDTTILSNMDFISQETLKKGNYFPIQEAQIKEGKTSPKKHFTDDTLLSAMENANKADCDTERKGIGTPATRAGIMEKLIKTGLVERKGDKKIKYFIPTNKGTALVTVLPQEIQSPLLTAEWEEKLKEIEQGKLSTNVFLEEISNMVTSLVNTYECVKGSETLFPPKNMGTKVGTCPRCGADVIENKKGFCCSSKNCQFVIWKENKFFTAKKKAITKALVTELLSKGQVELKGCYTAKTGKNYDCIVVLDDTGGKYVNFKIVFGKNRKLGVCE